MTAAKLKTTSVFLFFFQAEDGIRDHCVTGVQTCALPISGPAFGLFFGGILMGRFGWRSFFLVLGLLSLRSEERREGKSVDLGGLRTIEKSSRNVRDGGAAVRRQAVHRGQPGHASSG